MCTARRPRPRASCSRTAALAPLEVNAVGAPALAHNSGGHGELTSPQFGRLSGHGIRDRGHDSAITEQGLGAATVGRLASSAHAVARFEAL